MDESFFKHMNFFEEYYQNLSLKDDVFLPNYKVAKKINEILQGEELSLKHIQSAIGIFNKMNAMSHHDGTAWLDLSMHLRHIALEYGKVYVNDNDQFIIEE